MVDAFLETEFEAAEAELVASMEPMKVPSPRAR
jgi:hypothetical protein